MQPQNFMIFGTYKLHNAENEIVLSLCYYVNSYSPEGATNMSTFYLHYNSLTFFYFLADRTNGRAIATLLRLSVCRLWRYVLWLNGAS